MTRGDRDGITLALSEQLPIGQVPNFLREVFRYRHSYDMVTVVGVVDLVGLAVAMNGSTKLTRQDGKSRRQAQHGFDRGSRTRPLARSRPETVVKVPPRGAKAGGADGKR